MAGKFIKNLNEQVMVFECDLGWNGFGGLAEAQQFMTKHKLTAIAVGFTDGIARQVTLKELPKLKW